MSSDIPNDPCYLCLVLACCNDPCSILINYMHKVYDLVESDPTHPILDRFPKELQRGILDYVGKRKEIEDQIEEIERRDV